MTQTRIHDYHAPRSTADLNQKFVGLIPPGVYQGFHVTKDGMLAPGVLLTAEGVRIEETTAQQLTLTANSSTLPRRDLVVCEHEYQATLPNPEAHFRVIVGTAAADAPLPALPAHATLIAVCHMAANGSAWDVIEQNAVAPELLLNATRDGWQYRIVSGGNAALRIRASLSTGAGQFECYLHAGSGLVDGAVLAWGEPVFRFAQDGTPASIIKLADATGRFAADNTEAALAELAGANRTTQTVKANADAIALETQNRQAADSNLQTQITNHTSSTSAHNAANIPIADAGGRYAGTNTEAALQEIAGAGRTTETVKGVADAINNHKSDADGAHAASAISTAAITGSPLSLAASQLQTVLSSLVTALNARALKSGDTFSGAVTFNGGATFDAGSGDYPDGSGVKFDSDIWFYRTISSFAGHGISFSSYTPALDNDTYGGVQFSMSGHNLVIPIPLYGSSKLSRVRFYFQIPPNTSGRATLHLKVTSTPSFYAGTATFQPTIIAENTSFQSASPANSDTGAWTTITYELDCGHLEIGGSDYTKMVFATVIMTEAAGKALVCPGVKVAYKRTKVAV